MKLFSELHGFVIYEPLLLAEYLKRHNLNSKDVLSYFVDTDHGDIITREGIAIPVIGVPADYYSFTQEYITDENALQKSGGWIFNGYSGTVRVVGIGHFKDIFRINDSNSLSFTVNKGWHDLTIISFFDSANEDAGFLLDFKQATNKPHFYGDVETKYGFEQTT